MDSNQERGHLIITRWKPPRTATGENDKGGEKESLSKPLPLVFERGFERLFIPEPKL